MIFGWGTKSTTARSEPTAPPGPALHVVLPTDRQKAIVDRLQANWGGPPEVTTLPLDGYSPGWRGRAEET